MFTGFPTVESLAVKQWNPAVGIVAESIGCRGCGHQQSNNFAARECLHSASLQKSEQSSKYRPAGTVHVPLKTVHPKCYRSASAPWAISDGRTGHSRILTLLRDTA